MTEWTHLRHTEAAAAEIGRMAEVVRGRDGTTPVPTCPGWDLRELVEHTGAVHRWAAAMVRDAADRRYDRAGMDHGFPEDFAGHADWLEAGAVQLSEALKSRDPDTEVWGWAGDRSRRARFWSRRQLHETVVHRVDAEIALGIAPEMDEDVAIDGVEEFFDLLPYARWRPLLAELRGDGEAISWRTGTGLAWLVRLTPKGFTYERSEGPADVIVRAPTAGDLMLTLWNRLEPDAVHGDDELLWFWRERARI
ncbi:maleylpyruvate isomerase family mycothiol-dependent enzyme [Microbispora sp. NEAU-D428]|uniref:maleylpyruvate isomerase family mycothiol-dependent enzyme n=1 Tax=Microbispora sitophila TaxID=2771537 RepID=UPI001865CD84|nr:maleylpyruvate isomerase family mycothiol-dependent enzyme [Microbispora sitophila]MBE3009204.1 maleylpyruvate isomerase family mycothiol-dependent enzyme [Microbispora sitophila]